jgi:thiol:disulfide interchange protein DsbA
VVEFFSYQCPHCFNFSGPLDAWVKKLPRDVAFRRESVSIGHQPWEPAARTFYTLEALGKLDALDSAVFKAIHEQGARFYDLATIEAWMAQHSVPPADFRDAYESFGVETKFKRGDTLSRTFRIPSIPTLIIDGRYLVAIASNLDYGVQLANVDALIKRARSEKQLPAPGK